MTRYALIATIAAASIAAPAIASDRPEARLTRALEGFAAGDPVRCIRQRDIRSSQIYDGIGIVYETIGGVRYLNRPASGARSLRSNYVLVTDTPTPDLCDVDVVRLYDSSTQTPTGFVGLGKFVPYRKVDAKKAKTGNGK